MVMAQFNKRVQAQRRLKLLDGVQGSIAVLVGAPQQHMRKRIRGLQPDGFFQFLGGGRLIIRSQQHQRQIEMNVRATRVSSLRHL